MLRNKLEEKVSRWSTFSPPGEPDFSHINLQVQFLEDRLFFDYEPTKGPYPEFWPRLEAWIENFDDEQDQKTAFQLIPRLFYIGQEEFNTLYRVAVNGPVARWLIQLLNLMFDAPDSDRLLREAFKKTWFCPVTDSMRINGFYHLNGITTGHNLRPDWLTLSKIGDTEATKKYITDNSIEYIVLLEDFVGSGSQISAAISYAADLADEMGKKVLLLPMIICPKGVSNFNSMVKKHNNLTFESVIELKQTDFIPPTSTTAEHELSDQLRPVLRHTFDKVRGHSGSFAEAPYTPFGYRDTGGLVVMFSNCPDNTLPIVHHSSITWHPLFPRRSRI